MEPIEPYCSAGPYTLDIAKSVSPYAQIWICQACGAEIQSSYSGGTVPGLHKRPDNATIYADKILPLLQQIEDIAMKWHIPYVATFQTSADGYNTSYYAPDDAASEIIDSAKWWTQKTGLEHDETE